MPPGAPADPGKQAETITPAAAAEAAEASVGADDPVITIQDFCAPPVPPGDGCKTVITRAQFEKLTDALQPGMSLSLRLNVANAYARNLRMAAAAEKRGLDKTPAFAEEMRFARMQLLAQDLSRALKADAENIPDSEVAEYYKKNEASYEQATLARIFVPHAKQVVPARGEHRDALSTDRPSDKAPAPDAKTGAGGSALPPDEAQDKSAAEAMTQVAADLRALAVNGEDPDKLQIEAYRAAGLPGTAPSTKLEKVRRNTLPHAHESVLDLKPGEVSQVFSDPDGAHFIYKMIDKQTLTLDDATSEIRTAISSERYRDSMKSFQGNVVFSDAYFAPRAKASTPRRRNRGKDGKNPPP